MPYGYNRDAQNLSEIGQSLGTIVGAFIKHKRLSKSRMAAEREKREREEKEAKARKAVVDMNKYRLRKEMEDLPEEDKVYYGTLLDAPVDDTSLTFNEHLQTIASGISEAKMRKKKYDVEAAEKKKEEAEKVAQSDKLQRQYTLFNRFASMAQLTPQEQAQIDEFLDGTEEGLQAANELLKHFTGSRPKENKTTFSEEKASLTEEILALGNDDMNAGLQRLREVDPEKYRRAFALGIKSTETEDETMKWIEKIESEYKSRPDEYAQMPLADFGEKWLMNRKYIAPEVQQSVLNRLKGISGEPEEKTYSKEIPAGLPKEVERFIYGEEEPSPFADEQVSDEKKAEAIKAKPISERSDEEIDWLMNYLQKIRDAHVSIKQ